MNAKTRENIINLIIQHGEGLLDDSGVDEKVAVALADEIIEVVDARFVQFEYDTSFWGGDYTGSGTFALVPEVLCTKHGYEGAFERHIGVAPVHIVHYNPDELFDIDGSPLNARTA